MNYFNQTCASYRHESDFFNCFCLQSWYGYVCVVSIVLYSVYVCTCACACACICVSIYPSTCPPSRLLITMYHIVRREESLGNFKNRSWPAKLNSSTLILTINNLLVNLLIRQTFFTKCLKTVNTPNFAPAKLSHYTVFMSNKVEFVIDIMDGHNLSNRPHCRCLLKKKDDAELAVYFRRGGNLKGLYITSKAEHFSYNTYKWVSVCIYWSV